MHVLVCKAMCQGCKVLFVNMTDKFYPEGFRRSDVSEGGGLRERFDFESEQQFTPVELNILSTHLQNCNNKTPYPVPCSS